MLVATLFVGLLASPGVAYAAAGSCAVTPDPVPVGTAYTVDATGLTVSTAFVVKIKQTGFTALELIVASNETGAASTGPVQWGSTGPQEPGTATVSWRKWAGFPGGGGPILTYGGDEAKCTLTAV
jgi:hypothetical protein